MARHHLTQARRELIALQLHRQAHLRRLEEWKTGCFASPNRAPRISEACASSLGSACRQGRPRSALRPAGQAIRHAARAVAAADSRSFAVDGLHAARASHAAQECWMEWRAAPSEEGRQSLRSVCDGRTGCSEGAAQPTSRAACLSLSRSRPSRTQEESPRPRERPRARGRRERPPPTTSGPPLTLSACGESKRRPGEGLRKRGEEERWKPPTLKYSLRERERERWKHPRGPRRNEPTRESRENGNSNVGTSTNDRKTLYYYA
eukprot:scaffold245673_cov32-Tisochrysis_lutea.AAC.6